MPIDPYKPPSSLPESQGSERPVRGIVTGFGADILGTYAGIIVIGTAYASWLFGQGFDQEEIGQRLAAEMTSLTTLVGLSLSAFGLAMSFLGGFVCVRVARSANPIYPAIQASLAVVLSVFLSSLSDGEIGLFRAVMLHAASFAATMLGAVYARGPFARHG